jgi:hypothetical protein
MVSQKDHKVQQEQKKCPKVKKGPDPLQEQTKIVLRKIMLGLDDSFSTVPLAGLDDSFFTVPLAGLDDSFSPPVDWIKTSEWYRGERVLKTSEWYHGERVIKTS